MFDTRTFIIVLICWLSIVIPAGAKSNVELGNEAFSRDDYNKAIEYYRLAVDDKSTFAAYVNMGHCYMQLERWDLAVSAFTQAIETKPDAITGKILRALGRARFEGRQYEKAMDAYSKASKLESKNAQDNIWIARYMIELEQWIQAQSILLAQLRNEPGDTVTLELLACVYNKQNNWPGIIDIYSELLTIVPQKTSYRVALAKTLTIQGQKQQAIDTLEFARRVDAGSNDKIDHLLADLYLAEDMSLEAAGCYARIIKILDKPSSEDYYGMGLAYWKTGDLTSAEEAFSNMKQANPSNFKADLYLRHVIAEAGLTDYARTHYNSAIKKNPVSAEALVALADLQIKNKNYTEVAENLAKAIALGENQPQVHYNYILALMNDNDELSVREALKTALAEHPSNEQ